MLLFAIFLPCDALFRQHTRPPLLIISLASPAILTISESYHLTLIILTSSLAASHLIQSPSIHPSWPSLNHSCSLSSHCQTISSPSVSLFMQSPSSHPLWPSQNHTCSFSSHFRTISKSFVSGIQSSHHPALTHSQNITLFIVTCCISLKSLVHLFIF